MLLFWILLLSLGTPSWVFVLAYRESLAWAPITFFGFEKLPGDFEATLKRYIHVSRTGLVASATTAVFVLKYSSDLVPTVKSIRLWAPECILLMISAGLFLAFEISSTAAYDAYRRKYGLHYDEELRRWYALNKATAITALFSLGFAYFGLAVTTFG